MTAAALVTAAARRRGRAVRGRAAPAHAQRVHRAGSRPREPAGLDPGRAAARRGARSRAALRPARPRQDDAGARHRATSWACRCAHRRPGAREARRPRRHPDQPQAARGAVHRRDPPHVAGDRGDPLPGAGGLRARSRDRPGPGRALGEGAAAAVHAGRRDDPHRAPHRAAAQPLRHRPPPRLLRPAGHGARSCADRRGSSACRSTTRRRPSSRAGPAARRASPTGCCAASATTRRSAPTARSPSRSPRRRWPCSKSTSTASTTSIAGCCGRSSTSSAAGRSGSTPSPPRSARSRTRSRTSTSPS